MVRLSAYAIALLLCMNVHAQIIPFKNYGIKDGLNDNNVQAVIRDDRGLLWVGTDFGISWFDGKRFYQPQINTNISQLFVNGFYKDRDGSIWTLTFFNGIYKYKNGRFTNYLVDTLLNNAAVNSISNMVQVSGDKYVVISENAAYLFDGHKFSMFDLSNPALITATNDVTQLADETILFSTNDGIFFYRYDNGKLKLTGHVLKGMQIGKVLTTKKQLWANTNQKLLSYENTGVQSFSTTPKIYLANKPVRDITADRDGTIWTFTDNGTIWALTDTVFKIKNGEITQYTSGNGAPENIQQIYCDNAGLVWFANRKGISMLGDEYYEFSTIKNGRNEEPISSLITDRQNNLWIGTVNGMVLEKNSRHSFYKNIERQSIGYVTWLHKSKDGSFLAGTTTGVLKVDGNSIKKEFNIQSTAAGTDKEERMWFGDINGRIWKDEGKVLKPLKIDCPVNEMITAIHPVDKYIWVGYRDKGVVKYMVKDDTLLNVKEYSAATGYSDIRIRSSTIDGEGNIIWGTRTNGVFIFPANGDKLLAHIDTQNGLNGNWIKDIYCDADGKLYLATNNGISIVCGAYKSPSVKQIKINNDNINREANCILKEGGIFYIGTNEGVLKWMPGNIRKDTVPPPIYFTHISIQGLKKFSIDPYAADAGNISLSYDQHFISFEFAGISLKNPENVRYHYILDGQDNEWSPLTEHNDVAYNLKPGDYTFKVAAENADGVWSRHPALFHFIIRLPFWQTWWFILLMAIIMILAAYSAYRYKLSKMLALELLRNKISTDLHDDIGSTLSSISILSEVAVKEKEQISKRILGEINERSHQLMEKMDDIVWSISSRNDTVGNLLIRIQQFASTVLEAKGIEYEVNVPDRVKGLKLDMQRRQHIYLILKEAVNNLIKYSDCAIACINTEYTGGLLKIEVADNGQGFDIKNIQPGNGLLNMQRRTDAMRGTMLITSAPGKGTQVSLSIKIE